MMTGVQEAAKLRRVNRVTNLESYLMDIRTNQKLSDSECISLLERSCEGDQQARRLLIQAHLPDAAVAALTYCPPSVSPAEAVQEANAQLARLTEDGSIGEFRKTLRDRIKAHLRFLARE